MKVLLLLITALFCAGAFGQQASESSPISMTIVLDTSGSMGGKLALARQLVSELAKPANPLDEFALVQAADRPIVLSGFASAADALQTQITFTQAKGRSAILDAVYLGVQLAKAGRHARKAVIVVSDGEDNSSRYTEIETKNAISQTGVRVYAIGFDATADLGLLPKMAEYAGGLYLRAVSGSGAPQMAAEVNLAVRARP